LRPEANLAVVPHIRKDIRDATAEEFRGIDAVIVANRKKGTVRGMHFQFPPFAKTKLARCTRGAILDIIVDLRPESETYLECWELVLRNDL
jgi:dTDP-4-dehydrorhamnose 3,5-epimerase-like enzyme